MPVKFRVGLSEFGGIGQAVRDGIADEFCGIGQGHFLQDMGLVSTDCLDA